MSACPPFTVSFTQSPEELLEKAKKALTSYNGTLEGDLDAGSISVKTPVGKIEGTYAVAGQEITITITDKPMFLGCGMVEDQLKKALS